MNRNEIENDKYVLSDLKKSVESMVVVTTALATESALRQRADVLVTLADGLRIHGLRLLDFGKYFSKSFGTELLNAFEDATRKLESEDVKKAVRQLKDAIAAYPADEKNAFAPEERK